MSRRCLTRQAGPPDCLAIPARRRPRSSAMRARAPLPPPPSTPAQPERRRPCQLPAARCALRAPPASRSCRLPSAQEQPWTQFGESAAATDQSRAEPVISATAGRSAGGDASAAGAGGDASAAGAGGDASVTVGRSRCSNGTRSTRTRPVSTIVRQPAWKIGQPPTWKDPGAQGCQHRDGGPGLPRTRLPCRTMLAPSRGHRCPGGRGTRARRGRPRARSASER